MGSHLYRHEVSSRQIITLLLGLSLAFEYSSHLLPHAYAGTEASQKCEDRFIRFASRLVFTREQEPGYQDGYAEVLRLFKNDSAFYNWLKSQNLNDPNPSEVLGRYRAFQHTPGTATERNVAKASESTQPKNRVVDLSDPDALEAPHETLCQACDWLVMRDIRPREYAWRVMNLRKGDTVVFGDRSFVLGEFRGRGNAKHVWDIEGMPDAVLQIPFYAGPRELNKRSQDRPDFAVLGAKPARMFMAYFEDFSKAIGGAPVQKAEILEVGENHAYLVVSKVRGTQNGWAFLSNEYSKDPSDPAAIAKYNLLKKRALAVWFHILPEKRNDPLYFAPYYASEREFLEHEGRQFLFDGKDWVLVDWEYPIKPPAARQN